MNGREDIDAALVDVRRAYRLLYLYQRSVINLAQRVGDHFEKQPYVLAMAGGGPAALRPPFGVDAWKYLPLYCASFLFLSPDSLADPLYPRPRLGDWMLEVAAISDDSLLHRLGARVDFAAASPWRMLILLSDSTDG